MHAGIRPGVPWDEQTDEDLFWIREEFVLAAARPAARRSSSVTPRHATSLVHLPYKIGIDTGLVYGGALTALELPDRVLHQVRRASVACASARCRPVVRADLSPGATAG